MELPEPPLTRYYTEIDLCDEDTDELYVDAESAVEAAYLADLIYAEQWKG